MEDLVNYCKQYGFVFQGSEIYDGFANTWDFGPVGVEFKNFAASSELDIEYLIKEGNPAKRILEDANEEDVDLIVIGSSGKTGFDKFIMGSVADKIVSSADCAVLVIH